VGVIATPRAAVEVAAYRDLWSAAPPSVAEHHGIAHRDVAGGVCLGCAAMPGHPIFNHVIGLGVAAPAADAELDEVERFFDRLGVPYLVAADPGAPALVDALAARGYRDQGRPWMTFGRDPRPAPATVGDASLTVEDAGRSRASAFAAVVATAFDLPADLAPWMGAIVDRPGWTCLLALDRGEPVGAAAMFVAGDTAWLAFGATLPEHRGRGSQGALFAERLRRAERLGLRRAITETGAPVGDERPGPSYRNMLRVGFAEEGLRPNLRSPAGGS
jgi:GNAT superfamily N-acetyltransferase